ncbi:SPW repeat protein [Saccharopolyspora shandongensis]
MWAICGSGSRGARHPTSRASDCATSRLADQHRARTLASAISADRTAPVALSPWIVGFAGSAALSVNNLRGGAVCRNWWRTSSFADCGNGASTTSFPTPVTGSTVCWRTRRGCVPRPTSSTPASGSRS